MIISTLSQTRPFTEIGLVKGSVVKTGHAFQHFATSFRFVFGGNMKTYEDLLNETRSEAIDLMVKEAECYGADAVIGVRIQNSSIMEGASEILAYGTAIKYT